MKILVINSGSSSIKYELFNMEHQQKLISGVIEKIGEEQSILTHRKYHFNGELDEHTQKQQITDHLQGLNYVLQILSDKTLGAIQNKTDISAVGHRVVHGGEDFKETTLIDEKVILAIRNNIPLAPLHNPPNLLGIEVAQKLFPNIPHIAVFDTSFHQTMPIHAFLYAIPLSLYKEEKIRRYGFHGTSHNYVAEVASEQLNKPLEDCNFISIHLGNGASITAIRNGESIDTSMGLTPLEGLVMGTRSGDIDPALPFFLADQLGLSIQQIDTLLNKESGLKGLCGINDMREILDRYHEGNKEAVIALNVYAYRIKKYIGAYMAVLGKIDAIIFTAGIGENSSTIRKLCLKNMEMSGIELDEAKNTQHNSQARFISSDESRMKVLVIPTNEELKIAKETQKIIQKLQL